MSDIYSLGENREITCECSAVLKIVHTRQMGHNDREYFNCPECNSKHYIRASLPILSHQITVIKPKIVRPALTAPDISPSEFKSVLISKGYSTLYHSNTLQTSSLFTNENYLLSREYCETNGLEQTPQMSDEIDKIYGINDYIYFDLVDIHARASQPNFYGPVLFKFSENILDSKEIVSIRIMKRNPTKWATYRKLEERYYMNLDDFNKNYSLGDFDTMITLQTEEGKLNFGNYLNEIVIDNPKAFWKDSHQDVCEEAKQNLINSTNTSKIKIRTCKPSCTCTNAYDILCDEEKRRLFKKNN
jgi:hypothetical protein